jgi:hypothetical protein
MINSIATGYNDPNHWCYFTLKKYWKCPSETGLPMVIGRDPATDAVVCYGRDSRGCDMKMDDQRCEEFLLAFKSNSSYKSCPIRADGILASELSLSKESFFLFI